jgi:hypothetical protein
MRPLYNIYVSSIVMLKICLIILDIFIYYNKHIASDSTIDITNLEYYSKKLLAITEALMFFLLIIIFNPLRKTPNKNNAVIIVGHERGILFTLGIIGLLHIKM